MTKAKVFSAIVFSFLIIFTLGAVRAADPIEISYLGSTLWSYVYDVQISGNYAYCAMQHGLMILDVSNPSQPAFVSKLYFTRGHAEVITVSGDYAYVGNYTEGLYIVDISDPANPQLTGTLPVENWIDDIKVEGTHVFIYDAFRGVSIIDVSDPANPFEVGLYPATQGYGYIDITGDFLYYAEFYILHVIDISDPSNPTLISDLNIPNTIRGVTASGSLVFLAEYDKGLEIIDVSDPSTPMSVGTWGATCRETKVVGNVLYLAQGSMDYDYGGVEILDITNPALPIALGHLDVSSYDIDVSGDYIYSACSTYDLSVVDASNLNAPVLAGQYSLPYCYAYGQRGIITDGNYAYVAFGPAGLVVVDISNPANPVVVKDNIIPDRAFELDRQGNYLYVGANGDYSTEGLKIFDLTNPADPALVGSYRMSSLQEVTIDGDYAFLGGNSPYMDIVDISDRTHPVRVGQFYRMGIMFGIAVQGDYAYIANWQDELLTLYVADKTNPTLASVLPFEKDPWDAVIYKGYLLVAVQGGFYVMDITTNPAVPQEITFVPLSGGCDELKPYGNYLYAAASYSGGFSIFDMTDPTAPVQIGNQTISGEVKSVAPFYNYAFVVDQYGLMTFTGNLPPCCDVPGDASFDGATNVGDVVYLVNYVFKSGPPPNCPPSGDVNNDCAVNVGDAVALINHIFKGGPAPTCSGCL